jgi:hypothetical protein
MVKKCKTLAVAIEKDLKNVRYLDYIIWRSIRYFIPKDYNISDAHLFQNETDLVFKQYDSNFVYDEKNNIELVDINKYNNSNNSDNNNNNNNTYNLLNPDSTNEVRKVPFSSSTRTTDNPLSLYTSPNNSTINASEKGTTEGKLF